MTNPQYPANKAAKKLLAELGLPVDATTLNNGLILAGLMRIVRYESSTGSGEIKYYMELTEEGLQYGRNKPSGWHEFKTEPVFYIIKFAAAYLLSVTAIFEHAQQAIKQQTLE